jgi:hypothetical protein
MPETLLILLCGGVMLASAIPKPRDVTLHWLRLCGIIAITMLALSVFFSLRRETGIGRNLGYAYALNAIGVAFQLAMVQTNQPAAGRICAILSFFSSLAIAVALLGRPEYVPVAASVVGCAGVAAMCGIALMEMLLGHAYLTAAKMTIAPFKRMNFVFAAVLALRMFFGICAMLMEQRWPIELFWTRQAFLIGVRWVVGLIVPAIFVYMTHDCIKRRSTQSATGILYVCGVLVFVGEMVALYLTRETGLPF